MIWKALMKDGREILQNQNGIEVLLSELDKDKVDTFSLVDSAKTFVHLDLANGNFNLNNLDLTKLSDLNGSESLSLKYDSASQSFKMDTKSLELLNTLLLENERANHISFDQTGEFSINGIKFHLEFITEEEKYVFMDDEPYNDIIQLNDGATDFLGNSSSSNPYKRIDSTLAQYIGYNKEYDFIHVQFKLSLVLKYDLVQKCVLLQLLITVSEDIKGKIVIVLGNQESELQVSLSKNAPARLDRVLSLM